MGAHTSQADDNDKARSQCGKTFRFEERGGAGELFLDELYLRILSIVFCLTVVLHPYLHRNLLVALVGLKLQPAHLRG